MLLWSTALLTGPKESQVRLFHNGAPCVCAVPAIQTSKAWLRAENEMQVRCCARCNCAQLACMPRIVLPQVDSPPCLSQHHQILGMAISPRPLPMHTDPAATFHRRASLQECKMPLSRLVPACLVTSTTPHPHSFLHLIQCWPFHHAKTAS